jgi:hypothetical protein
MWCKHRLKKLRGFSKKSKVRAQIADDFYFAVLDHNAHEEQNTGNYR